MHERQAQGPLTRQAPHPIVRQVHQQPQHDAGPHVQHLQVNQAHDGIAQSAGPHALQDAAVVLRVVSTVKATPAPEDQSPARDAHAPAHAPAHASSARTRMEHPAVHDEPPASAPSARARMKRPARDQSPDEPPASAPSARARMKRPARDQSPDKPPASAREVAGEEPPISARARMKRPARDQSSDSGRPRKVARPTITPPPPSSQEDDDLKAAIQASLADRVSHSAHAPPHAPSHAPPHAPSSSSSISHGAGSSMRRGSGSSVRRGGGGGAGSSSQRSAVPSVSLGAGTTSSSCSRGPPPSHASSSSTSISHSAGPSSVWHGTVPSVWRGAGPSSVRLSLSTPAWVPAVASGSGTMSAPASGPSQTPSSYEDDLQAALEASISEMSLPQSILRCMEPGHPGCENCSHTDEDDDDEYLAALEASRAEAVHTAAALETRASSPWGNLSDSGQSEHEALRDSTLALLADLDRLSPAPPSEGSPYLDANGREMLAVVRTSIALMRSETPDSLFDEDSDEEEALLDADATLRDAPLLTFSGSESDASLPNRPSPPRIKIEHVDIDLTLDDSDDDDVVPPLPQAPPRRLATPRRLVKIERVDIDLTLDDDEEDAAVHV
ncbi:hypothetical protein TRAPUB_12698 [Trametes pubescens]|uniref:Uncharacterized protein n=1 Tax=Trametes pubescens TaxID=154538 RepID=A0A1M2VT56_TRAPU|nr:hypothetical protein TRAPUB_12698 [Trametes pubescens]